MTMRPDPRADYDRRLAARRTTLDELERRDGRLANGRLVVFVAVGAVAAFAATVETVSAFWIAVPAVAFLVLVVMHARTIQAKELAKAAVGYYESALARLDFAWQGKGIQRTDYVADDHPYAADLDLFGRGSLFELLCAARTAAGERTLASWLTAPAHSAALRQRHAAINELRERVDMREELALLGGGMRSEVHPDVLIRWGAAPPLFTRKRASRLRWVAWALALPAPIATGLLFVSPVGIWVFVGAVLVNFTVLRLMRSRLEGVLAGVGQMERELDVLSGVLERIEREPLECPHLSTLKRALTVTGTPASRGIGRLRRLVSLLDAQRNQFFAPFAFLTMWGLHFSLAIERWRESWGPAISSWLDAVGELEALCSLAGYAYERPADPFPTFVDSGPIFAGEQLGHPLLPDDACVRNNIALDSQPAVWVVSGSNMSGKSTFMRVVGVNAVLAMAGAPVRARSLTLSPLSVGATIRIQDSLQEGSSRFYAEIQRLKQLMELAGGERPLLFLLDEILHGTNSHDRQIGADAVIRSLIRAGAIGLVTTHDLALTGTADELGSRAANVHFEDRLDGGRLVFDYELKQGIVRKSNALDLMRSVGLDV